MLILSLLCFISFSLMVCGQHSKFDFKYATGNKKSYVSSSSSSNRRLANANETLAQKWWNWNLCTNAYHNANFTPTNSLVPNGTIFLATYPTKNLDNNTATCKSKTITRTATIGVGKQTIFYPLDNLSVIDYEDDYKEMKCANFTNETLPQRLAFADSRDLLLKDESFIALLYSKIDGKDVAPTYIYIKDAYYLSACPGNPNKTYRDYFILEGTPEGDTCDNETFQQIDGLDSYPTLGWYGIDTREWKDGENHTYEFGSLYSCFTAKYEITAKAEEVDVDECGLFGLGLFCPLKWFQWLCDLFT